MSQAKIWVPDEINDYLFMSKDGYMVDVFLKCSCGQVKGIAKNITQKTVIHLVCYCDDCQAYACYLDQENSVLDPCGGTEILQITPSQIEITEGAEELRSLRLTSKGILRWYTACCHTPVANTMSVGMPFVGMIHSFLDNKKDIECCGNQKVNHIQVKYAKKKPVEGQAANGFPVRLILKTMTRLVVAKLKGKSQPTPFFDADGKPVSSPKILRDSA